MLIERISISNENETTLPSEMWTKGVSVFSYIMNLSPDDLKNIRFHTGLINGGSWRYWETYPEPDAEQEARALGYVEATAGLPQEY